MYSKKSTFVTPLPTEDGNLHGKFSLNTRHDESCAVDKYRV
jgi:hypothetical protein